MYILHQPQVVAMWPRASRGKEGFFKSKLNDESSWQLSCFALGFLGIWGPFYSIPYHTIPYHTIPYHTIPYHTIPYHTIPYHTIPYHTILYYTILYYTILYYTILYYTIYCVIFYSTVLYFTFRIQRLSFDSRTSKRNSKKSPRAGPEKLPSHKAEGTIGPTAEEAWGFRLLASGFQTAPSCNKEERHLNYEGKAPRQGLLAETGL